MKFSRLRLSGFKSFVDPVDFEILPGLTGVVGPNGCGKSNLLEALRWVMGETSYKSMRGAGMEDVIFSGTNSRPSRNYAEVALYLDNQDRTAPSEYNDEELIEVIRRIERDAGSAYRINAKDVRARDVQLMFADASTGARSPALVKQGQIGELINAKPENRRKILEEAAGISGLHTRRHEAELRLRGAENNLEKVDDMLGNLETQLRGLKRQARQATRYRNLSGQIREVEALALHLRWQQAVDAAKQAALALKQAEEAVAVLTGGVTQATAQQLEAQNTVPPLRESEVVAAAALRRIVIEREGLEQEETRARETIERLTQQLSTIQQDKSREQTALGDASEQLARLEMERSELSSGDSEEAKQAEIEAQNAVTEAERILVEVETRLDETNKQIAERSARLRELGTAKAHQENRRERITNEMSRLHEERDSLLAENVPEMETNELKTKIEKAVQAEDAAAKSSLTAQENLTNATEAAERLVEPAKSAQAVAERLVGERAALSAMFANPEGPSWPSLVDSVSVAAGYEAALGAVLGDDLDASSDNDAPAHWLNLPPLNPAQPLPEGVRPLSDFVQGTSSLNRRLSQIGVVAADVGKRLHSQLRAGQRLVSMEGDVWRWDGYCAAAEAPTPAAQRLAQRNRLKELEQELKTAEAESEHHRIAADKAREKARGTADVDREQRHNLREAQKQLIDLREQLAEIERGAAKHTSRLAAIEEASQRIMTDIQESEIALTEVNTGLQALETETNPTEGIEGKQQAVAQARAELATSRAAQAGLTRERQERENRLLRIQEERTGWENRSNRAQEQIRNLSAREASAEEEKMMASDVPESLVERRNALIGQITLAEEKRRVEADRLAEAETALAEADKILKQREGDLSEARELRARLEATVEGAREREDEASQRIRETIQVEPEQALKVANHDPEKPFPDAEDIEAKLERFRRERENLGGVNLRAEEEAEEITTQIEELSKEKDDLTQAINKLRHGIGQLNREGRERLLKAFDTVNGHFKRLFTQLFGGGTAELKFTESDDPLQAGLEIIAHPPGKKPQLMSLLSGGEQALTAMSLIFAVFLTNPSPICVLDEVDAPLDDANVERFCNMISEIADTTDTRFLLITHHALTMARVDRLFGVTMQERGVSQLISVDLATAEQFSESGQQNGQNGAENDLENAAETAG